MKSDLLDRWGEGVPNGTELSVRKGETLRLEGLRSFAQGEEQHRARFDEINGADATVARAFADELRQAFPECTRHFWELAIGEVLARGVLQPKTNELVVIVALTASGQSQERVRKQISVALRAGCSPIEIIEVIVQSGVCGKYEEALKTLRTAREAFAYPMNRALIRKQVRYSKRKEGKRRHGWYTSDVLDAIRKTGQTGLAPQEIAREFHLRRDCVYMWFSRTKKKDRQLQRTPTGRYVYQPVEA